MPYLWPKDAAALKRRVIAALFLLLAAKVINVQIPFIYKAVVDSLTGEAALVLPLALLLAYGAARVGASLFGELRDALFSRVSQRAGRRISLRVFDHLFALSLRYHLERRTGELSRAIERGVKATTFLLGMVLFNIGPTLFEFVLVIGILLARYPWPFAAITFGTIAGYAVFTIAATEWRIAYRRRMNEKDNQVAARSVDSLINYETVKSFANERYEAERLNGALGDYEEAAVRSQWTLSLLNMGQAVIVACGITAIMIMAARGVVAGTLTVGDLVLVNTFLLQLYQPLNILGFVYREVKQSLTDLDNLSQLLALEPEIQDRASARPLTVGEGVVRFHGVDFAYDSRRPVLQSVDFTVPPGGKLALVGASGSGKSTIARLLFRFYDVDSGKITIDGQDLREVTQDSLRRAIGIVPQDTVLFNDTIRSNIAYGRIGAPDHAVEEAARMAQIHTFIESLPDGYETVVGERGLKLSGGEKQRVAVARMILKDPKILILDEATSALDSRTERALQQALANLTSGRTSLVIAHRLSTIADADQILVLEAGEVIERGDHDQLLARAGRYASMWREQERRMETLV
ncbi:MAG: ABCB family ABC transporter ATP-binding protein/permease [Geminicoccaceae bacterium]